jgi:hypothetical protein
MDAHEFLVTLGGFWPAGDPGQCRQGSAGYRQHAGDLATIQAACQSTAQSVRALNQGPPIDGFAAWWAKWESNPGYFTAAIRECNQLADALDAYAHHVEESQHRLIELGLAALAALAVGVALTFFTAGLSDAAAGAIEAGLVAASFTECATLAAVAGDIVVAVGAGAIEGVVFDGAVQLQAINVFHDQQRFNWSELGQSAALGGLTGGIGAGAGIGLRAGARLLPTLADASPMLGRTLNALDKIPGTIRNGMTGTIAGGGFAAAFDQLTTGHVNPQDVLIGALSGGAGGAIGGRGRGVPRTAVDTPQPHTVTIRFEDGFSRPGFNKKAAALVQLGDEGLLVKAPNPVARDPQLTRTWKADLIRRIYRQYGAVNPEFAAAARQRVLTQLDADHIHDLQLGGPDTAANLWLLDSTTNRVMGTRQIWPQIRRLPDNTPIRIVVDRGPTNGP